MVPASDRDGKGNEKLEKRQQEEAGGGREVWRQREPGTVSLGRKIRQGQVFAGVGSPGNLAVSHGVVYDVLHLQGVY